MRVTGENGEVTFAGLGADWLPHLGWEDLAFIGGLTLAYLGAYVEFRKQRTSVFEMAA